jgi:hypothetical protein
MNVLSHSSNEIASSDGEITISVSVAHHRAIDTVIFARGSK